MRGCNFRCPYCYNTELVEPSGGNQSQAQKSGAQANRYNPQFVSIQDVIAHLKKRAAVLSGFVISGGEPLCQPDIVRGLILEARSLGYKIKLDTNGSFPDRLQELLSDPACAPDYVALDVKTAPARYSELQAQDAAAQKIIESIKIVSAMPADAREFRTVLYPPLVGQADIKEIASLLPKDARWFFAHFLNGHCLSAAAQNVQPYTEEKEAALLELARSFIPGAELR